MAIDSNGLTYEYRTLHFNGYAYGSDSNVSITASINGTVVYSGEVPTINSPIPPMPVDSAAAPLLFSIDNSTLFPTNWAGSYPMSVEINGGHGVVFNGIFSNYMSTGNIATTVMENSSISGNVLTVGTVSSGTVLINQLLNGTDIVANTRIVSGSDTTWIVSNSQTVPNTTITGNLFIPTPGVADEYQPCYNRKPVNSEDTPDPRSSITIDGIAQVPPLPKSPGTWGWMVPTGSTIAYNLNISVGNCAQS